MGVCGSKTDKSGETPHSIVPHGSSGPPVRTPSRITVTPGGQAASSSSPRQGWIDSRKAPSSRQLLQPAAQSKAHSPVVGSNERTPVIVLNPPDDDIVSLGNASTVLAKSSLTQQGSAQSPAEKQEESSGALPPSDVDSVSSFSVVSAARPRVRKDSTSVGFLPPLLKSGSRSTLSVSRPVSRSASFSEQGRSALPALTESLPGGVMDGDTKRARVFDPGDLHLGDSEASTLSPPASVMGRRYSKRLSRRKSFGMSTEDDGSGGPPSPAPGGMSSISVAKTASTLDRLRGKDPDIRPLEGATAGPSPYGAFVHTESPRSQHASVPTHHHQSSHSQSVSQGETVTPRGPARRSSIAGRDGPSNPARRRKGLSLMRSKSSIVSSPRSQQREVERMDDLDSEQAQAVLPSPRSRTDQRDRDKDRDSVGSLDRPLSSTGALVGRPSPVTTSWTDGDKDKDKEREKKEETVRPPPFRRMNSGLERDANRDRNPLLMLRSKSRGDVEQPVHGSLKTTKSQRDLFAATGRPTDDDNFTPGPVPLRVAVVSPSSYSSMGGGASSAATLSSPSPVPSSLLAVPPFSPSASPRGPSDATLTTPAHARRRPSAGTSSGPGVASGAPAVVAVADVSPSQSWSGQDFGELLDDRWQDADLHAPSPVAHLTPSSFTSGHGLSVQSRNSTALGHLTREELAAARKREIYKRAFDKFDLDGSGTMDSGQVRALLLEVGMAPDSDEELLAAQAALDPQHTGVIAFDAFLQWSKFAWDYYVNKGKQLGVLDGTMVTSASGLFSPFTARQNRRKSRGAPELTAVKEKVELRLS